MKKIFLIFILIILISHVSASCSEGQIDINIASIEELDELYGIGPVKAQAIIDSRPYETLNDLTNAYGIAEKTLNKIKEQGLACVSEEIVEVVETPKEKITEVVGKSNNNEKESIQDKTLSPIVLIPKDIKSDSDVKSNKEKYAIYGFIIFCILLASLFLIKYLRTDKNEFN